MKLLVKINSLPVSAENVSARRATSFIFFLFLGIAPANAYSQESVSLRCDAQTEIITELNGRAPAVSGPFQFKVIYDIEGTRATSSVISDPYASGSSYVVEVTSGMYILTPTVKRNSGDISDTTSIDRRTGELRGKMQSRLSGGLMHAMTRGTCILNRSPNRF